MRTGVDRHYEKLYTSKEQREGSGCLCLKEEMEIIWRESPERCWGMERWGLFT